VIHVGSTMMIEIQKPELEALILDRMQKGGRASLQRRGSDRLELADPSRI